MAVDEKPIASLAEYASTVAGGAGDKAAVWFRGARDAGSHRLIPTLFRHPEVSEFEHLNQKEQEMMTSFRHRSPPFLAAPLPARDDKGSGFETLFIMQHYGIPTRLLDWTENPFVALYFALGSGSRRGAADKDAAVWTLKPTQMNRVSLNNQNIDRVLSIDDDFLHGYEPTETARNMRNMPVAIFGVHNSRRIVSQRGVFVLFGSDTKAMEEQNSITESGALQKLIIAKDNIEEMRSSLFRMGFTDSVVFPDLDGLAKEISYSHGF